MLPLLARSQIVQIGIVVPDLEQGLRTWSAALGLGPWIGYHFTPETVRDFTYRGHPADYSIDIALTSSGPQVELIAVHGEHSLYHEWTDVHGYGIQHLGIRVADMVPVKAEMLAEGYELVQSGHGYGGRRRRVRLLRHARGFRRHLRAHPGPRAAPRTRLHLAAGRMTRLAAADPGRAGLADPGRAGLDPARLARLDGFLRRLIEDGRIPGWSLAIARRGVLAHASTGGYRDIEAALPIEADTLFRVYSMAKPVTAVAALLLCERGDLELSDPVARFIPSFASLRVYVRGPDQRPVTEPAIRPVTLWHLLTHTAGLTYGFHRVHPVDALYRQAGHDIEAPPGCSLAEACDTWAGLPLLFQPGSEWNYSVGTDVLGRVVEVVTGQSLGEFCAGGIFMPLGMPDTAFSVPAADLPRLARLYAIPSSGGLTPAGELATTVTRADRGHFGGGGLVSSTADYLRFAVMLLNGGTLDGARVLAPATTRFMIRNHLPGGADLASFGRPMNAESPLAGVGQGLGVSVLVDPVLVGYPASAGEFGWGGAASTVFWADPALDLAVVFMTQALPSAALPIRGKLHQLVHQAVTS